MKERSNVTHMQISNKFDLQGAGTGGIVDSLQRRWHQDWLKFYQLPELLTVKAVSDTL